MSNLAPVCNGYCVLYQFFLFFTINAFDILIKNSYLRAKFIAI